MTEEQEQRVKEIYGPDYEETDIPTLIRNAEKSEAEQEMADDLRQRQ